MFVIEPNINTVRDYNCISVNQPLLQNSICSRVFMKNRKVFKHHVFDIRNFFKGENTLSSLKNRGET